MAELAEKVIEAKWGPDAAHNLIFDRNTVVGILNLCDVSDDGFVSLDIGEARTLAMHNDESVLERRYNELLNKPKVTPPEPESEEPDAQSDKALITAYKSMTIELANVALIVAVIILVVVVAGFFVMLYAR